MDSTISSEITVKELLKKCPQLLQLFIDMELLCIGCPAESFHTLAEVAREYRLDQEEFLRRISTEITMKKHREINQ